jgi:glycosyltransferase involved in cell wall biosynthesis
LCRHLASDDVKITHYTMKWWDTRPPDGAVSYRSISPKLTMYRDGRRSMVQAAIFAIFCMRLLWARFDVIEADHMPYLPLFTLWFVAKVRRTPLIVTWHEVWGPEYWASYLGQAGRIGSMLESMATKIPTVIVAASSGTARRLEEMGVARERIEVIPGGVDASRLEAIPPAPDAPTLISVSRLIDHKRVDLTIEVAAALIAQGRSITLGVVGDGPDRVALEEQSVRLGIAEEVTFYGSIADTDEMLALLRGAAVLVYPTEREGFGLVAAEALALGVPVVTSSCETNEARRLVDDGVTGSIVQPGDVEGFTAAVAGWLDHEGHAAIRTQFFAAHPDVDWSNMAISYRGVLNRVVEV